MKSLFVLPLVASLGASAPVAKPSVVEVIATDYAFRVPTTMIAGNTTFRFRNDGKQRHEFNIFLLKPGATVEQVVDAGKSGKPQSPFIEGSVGVLFADPGSNSPSGLATNLIAGRSYGILCIFKDSADKPAHYAMGMYSTIHITSGAATSVARKADTQSADSVIAVDYAYSRMPRKIPPGRRTLVFRNDGKHRHEINVGLLRKGVTLDSLIAVDKMDGDVAPLFDKHSDYGVLYSDAGKRSFGSLTIDFLPGREYVIECGFQDDDKALPHYKLGMYGSIKVQNK